MISFYPESRITPVKTLDGAQKFVDFLTRKFTGNPTIKNYITFRSIIETDGQVSVYANIPVNKAGHELFKEAITEFKAQYVPVTA